MQTAITRTLAARVRYRRQEPPFRGALVDAAMLAPRVLRPCEHLPAKSLLTVTPVTASVDDMTAPSYDPERPLGYDENVGIDVSEPRRDQPVSW
jgi:hypothetical protein